MLSQKKLATFASAYHADVTAVTTAFEKELAQVEDIGNAGERYQALLAFEDSLRDAHAVAGQAYTAKVEKEIKKLTTPSKLILLVPFTAMVAGGLGFALPVLAIVAAVGCGVLGVSGYVKGALFDGERAVGAVQGMQKPAMALLDAAYAKRETILRDELKGIAASKSFDALYKRDEVKAAFTKASARIRVLEEKNLFKGPQSGLTT